jgi:hypothetical protein
MLFLFEDNDPDYFFFFSCFKRLSLTPTIQVVVGFFYFIPEHTHEKKKK